MANIRNTLKPLMQHGAPSPYGNAGVFRFILMANAAGVIENYSGSAAPVVGDVIQIGELPEGMRLDDFQAIVSTGFSGLAGKLGFQYQGDYNDANQPQDDEYFAAALPLTVGRVRAAGTKKPVTLPKPAWLTLTVTAAATGGNGRVDIVVVGELQGPR